MKKVLPVILSAAFAVLILFQGELKAVEMSAGAATWFAWWDFDDHDSTTESEIDPAFLYGPSLSAKFSDDFNLTFQFLYGTFDWIDTYDGEDHKYKFSRTDSDLALNYRLNSYFKVFAGCKYMGYKRTEYGAVTHQGLGPGAGVSMVVPLGANFYLLGNFSGFYLYGKDEMDQEGMDLTIKSKYHEYGTNSSLALAYYIEAADTTLSIGGRYQDVKSDYYYNSYEGADNSDMDHKFYGVTASATYSFSI